MNRTIEYAEFKAIYLTFQKNKMNRIMRKPAFVIWEQPRLRSHARIQGWGGGGGQGAGPPEKSQK